MYVASLTIDLLLPHAHSLKDKRGVVRPILEGCRRRYAVAAAEVAHQDLWQRSTLGMATVAASPGHAEDVLDAVERFVWSFPEAEVTTSARHWLELEAD